MEKWLKELPSGPDYDAHQALVQGLEHFNAEQVKPTRERMQILLSMEAAGLPLQEQIVEQYVRNQVTLKSARQALWRESWAFWSLLADAWMQMLKHAHRDPACAELKADRADMAARALRYTGRAMRWDYHQAREPAGTAWRRVHRIYRLVERDGYATREVFIDGCGTHCAREYAQLAVMGIVQPLGYRVHEIESMAQMIEADEALPLPALVPQPGVHTHMVDLSHAEGPKMLGGEYVAGPRLRYFATRRMVDHLRALDCDAGAEAGLASQMATLVERGGAWRNRERTHSGGRVWVASGVDAILAVLAGPEAASAATPYEPWILRDESAEGMGLARPESRPLPVGRLVAVNWDAVAGTWQLLVIRWVREVDGRQLIGAQSLSRYPKRVEIQPYGEGPMTNGKDWAIFLPTVDAEQGVSTLLLPQGRYRQGAVLRLRDGDVVYRLRLGAVQETHEGWVRVVMDVLGRTQLAAAA
ncbi:MAG TPA: hypothetical protein PKC12_01335 [Thiobacillaceae bacterium]|nr:hypothetical protein [Thiobacillaceae bacterium]